MNALQYTIINGEMILQRLHTILHQKCHLQPHSTILLGVSGGADSLCLMDVCWHLGLKVHVVHFDHRLRPESSQDAQAVAEMAAARRLPFISQQAEVRSYADQRALSLEAAARELRYRFLFDAARRLAAQAVMVAHTADDQVETVLMHLLRGSGLDGLAGMPFHMLPNPWSDEIALVRPLLSTWREEILVYLQREGLQPLQDSSNQDVTYFRNRLRLETLPYLEQVRPGFRLALHRTAEILSAERELVEEAAAQAWQYAVRTRRQGVIALDAPAFRSQPLAIQRRLLRRAVAELRPGCPELDFAAVERGRNFVLLGRPGRVDLTSGLWLACEQELAWVAAWEAELPGLEWPEAPAGEELVLPLPGRAPLAHGWRLVTERIEGNDLLEMAAANRDPYQAWLDEAALQFPLTVRRRKPGDRLQPLGMPAGRIKISDLMINQRLPRRARAAWPLVLSGDQIAWAPGLHTAHAFRLTQASRSAVHLQLVHDPVDML